MEPKLRLKPQEGLPKKLAEGEIYHFQKRKLRWFHSDTKVELINKYECSIGLVKILSSSIQTREINGKVVGITKGDYQVIKLYYEN